MSARSQSGTARELPATAKEHQAIVKRQTNPTKSLTFPERKAIKLTTEKWRRFIDHVANSGYSVADALKACDIPRETYNTFVLTDQDKRDAVADARVTWSRRFWTDEVLEDIYLAIANGQPIRHAVAERASVLLEADPVNSFYALCTADVEIAASLAAARRIAMENMADEILEIADDNTNDVIMTTDKTGASVEVSNPSAVRRAETKIKTRQWLMSKLHGGQFGDKPLVEINNNLTVNHVEQLDDARRRMEGAEERREKMLKDPSVVANQ